MHRPSDNPPVAATPPPVTMLVGMSGASRAPLRAAVEHHGPIGFDEYMEIALYGPAGSSRPADRPGPAFVTSPHVHPFVFAHCLRDALLDAGFGLCEIEPLPIVELGAGNGTLADSLLSSFASAPPRDRVHRRRISPVARDPSPLEGSRRRPGLRPDVSTA